MLCSNCGSFSTVLVNSLDLGGVIQEAWDCKVCNSTSFRTLQALSPYTISSAMQTDPSPAPKTRQDKINEYWDNVKAVVERLTPLDSQMIYFILYQQGMRIDGLVYKIDEQVAKKFPKEGK